ncbi:major facilitator superfamily domain-containing protein [Aspergillus similis]
MPRVSWRLGFVISALCLGTFLVALDTTIISVAVPSIATGYQAFDDVGWYGTAYLLTVTAFQPAFGSIFKIFNAKPAYLTSVLIFECALSIVGLTVSLEKRPLYLGVVLNVFGIAACLGPPLGGILTENTLTNQTNPSNLPIGGLSFVLILTRIILIMASVCCLVLALHWGASSLPWGSSRVIGLFIGAGLLPIAFVITQSRLKDRATDPLRVLRQRSIMMGALFSFFLEMSIYVTLYFIPFYFQSAQLVSPTTSGVRGIPLAVSQIAAVVITGAIVSRTGHYAPFMVLGQAVSNMGTALLTRLKVGTSTVLWATYLVVTGVGHGMGLQMPFLAVQVVLSDTDVPVGNAIIDFISQLGAAIAIAIGQSALETSLTRNVQMQMGQSDFPVPADTVIAAGPTGLQALANTPAMLRSLQDVYAGALQSVMYFALGTACVAVPFALGMEWRNAKVEGAGSRGSGRG